MLKYQVISQKKKQVAVIYDCEAIKYPAIYSREQKYIQPYDDQFYQWYVIDGLVVTMQNMPLQELYRLQIVVRIAQLQLLMQRLNRPRAGEY